MGCGGGDGVAFGAEGFSVGAVFDVGAGDDLGLGIIGHDEGGSYGEVGEGGVGVGGRCAGGLDELLGEGGIEADLAGGDFYLRELEGGHGGMLSQDAEFCHSGGVVEIGEGVAGDDLLAEGEVVAKVFFEDFPEDGAEVGVFCEVAAVF